MDIGRRHDSVQESRGGSVTTDERGELIAALHHTAAMVEGQLTLLPARVGGGEHATIAPED
jgi:hypothetical protein